MKDSLLSKLTNTIGGQRATQYKKIIDALPVFYADKGYRFIDDVIWTNIKLQEAAFLPTYPVATLWSTTYHVNVLTVDLNAAEVNGARPQCTEVQQKSHIFDPNLQK